MTLDPERDRRTPTGDKASGAKHPATPLSVIAENTLIRIGQLEEALRGRCQSCLDGLPFVAGCEEPMIYHADPTSQGGERFCTLTPKERAVLSARGDIGEAGGVPARAETTGG
jgi:hypothetical protein